MVVDVVAGEKVRFLCGNEGNRACCTRLRDQTMTVQVDFTAQKRHEVEGASPRILRLLLSGTISRVRDELKGSTAAA